MTESNYVAGVCNINPKEITKRRVIGHVGLAIVVAFAIIAIALHFFWPMRLLVFFLAILMGSGYIQAMNKFCTGYAGAGQQHADDGEIVEITNQNHLKTDQVRARKINMQTIAIAVVIAAILAIIPV